MTDALADILESIRMRGSIFSRANLAAPWGIESGATDNGVFHAVVGGTAWIRLGDGGPIEELLQGDIAIMPFGDNHLMTDVPSRLTRPIGELTSIDDRGMGQLAVAGDGPHTSLICGTLSFDNAPVHPVFSVLPRLFVVRDRTGRLAQLIECVIQMIAGEVDEPVPGSETVVARLTEVLIVYALRTYINSLPPGEGGWLGGLGDPVVASALGLIHRSPRELRSVDDLARSVGLSRSAFHTRFKSAVGETPADYLTRWRVHLAARLLREKRYSVAAAGREVGYGTEASFSNAFTRVMGIRPGAYKNAA